MITLLTKQQEKEDHHSGRVGVYHIGVTQTRRTGSGHFRRSLNESLTAFTHLQISGFGNRSNSWNASLPPHASAGAESLPVNPCQIGGTTFKWRVDHLPHALKRTCTSMFLAVSVWKIHAIHISWILSKQVSVLFVPDFSLTKETNISWHPHETLDMVMKTCMGTSKPRIIMVRDTLRKLAELVHIKPHPLRVWYTSESLPI